MPFTSKQQTKLFLSAIKPEAVKNIRQQADKKFLKSKPTQKIGSAPKFTGLKKLLGKI